MDRSIKFGACWRLATPSAETPNPDIVAGRATTLRLYIRALGMLGQTSEWRPTCQRAAPAGPAAAAGAVVIRQSVAMLPFAPPRAQARGRGGVGGAQPSVCARGSSQARSTHSETFFWAAFWRDGQGRARLPQWHVQALYVAMWYRHPRRLGYVQRYAQSLPLRVRVYACRARGAMHRCFW